MAGRWDLGTDYIRVNSSSPYSLDGGATAMGTGIAYATVNNFDFPSTFSKSDMVRLIAKYKIDKTSSVRFNYGLQKLASADPLMYNGLQTGAANAALTGSTTAVANGVAVPVGSVYPISALMPTNEQAPNHKVQSIGVTYIYSFQ